jgi:hypothetical protein
MSADVEIVVTTKAADASHLPGTSVHKLAQKILATRM